MTVSPAGGSIFTEFGTGGVKRSGGYIDDEPLVELRGARGAKIIRQMLLNDPIIGALLFTIKMLVRQVDWRVEAASEDNADQQIAEFIREALFEDMAVSWHDTLSDVVTFLPWGWELSELVYKRRSGDSRDASLRSKFSDGKIGWQAWPIRSQETLSEWQFDPSGNVTAMVQVASPDYLTRTIPIEKALLFRSEPNRGNPQGYSILRNAYRPWRMKTRIENLEGIGIERDLAGLPVIKLPPEYMAETASPAQKAVYAYAQEMVANIRNDEQGGVVMPMAYDKEGHPLFELMLLSTGGARQFNINETINRYDHRILASVLADFILLGAEKVGSFALSSDKTALFAVALGAWLQSIAGVVNTDAIPRLLRLNGMPTEAAPRLAHGDIEVPDLTELADYIQRLVMVGVLTPDPSLEAYARQVASLPALPEEVPA